MVIEARSKEVQYTRGKWVYDKIPRQRVLKKKGWKIIKTRCIDINKGDDANPVHRSRLVGKEFNNEAMDGIFAGIPPLEARRYIVHEAATIRKGEGTDSKVIMINDVSRAFFEAPAVRQVYVELPEAEEDVGGSQG